VALSLTQIGARNPAAINSAAVFPRNPLPWRVNSQGGVAMIFQDTTPAHMDLQEITSVGAITDDQNTVMFHFNSK
jgi:hypothetical protein